MIWRGVHTMKLYITRFSPVFCYLAPLRPKHLPQHPIVDHSKPIFSPQPETPRWTNIQNITHIILTCIFIFTILDNEGKYRRIYWRVPGTPTVQMIKWQQITKSGRILSWPKLQEHPSISREVLKIPTKTRAMLIHETVEIRTTCVSYT